MPNKKLQKAWIERCALVDHGCELMSKGNKMLKKVNKMLKTGNRMVMQGGDFIYYANSEWKKIVEEVYGKNVEMEWKNWNKKKQRFECHLDGEIFKP